jgi:hypothetical protein
MGGGQISKHRSHNQQAPSPSLGDERFEGRTY